MLIKSLASFLAAITFSQLAFSQSWTPLTNPAPFSPGTAFLLTDGTVMVQNDPGIGGGMWWKLTPDAAGSYIDGTWSQLASMPSGYAPRWYGSAILPDGRLIVQGGEYNGSGTEVWTNLGAIYSPISNMWISVPPPTGWSQIGDAASGVLSNGTFVLAGFFYNQMAQLNATTLTWTVTTPSGKADNYDEEGWTLLPNNTFLTVDAWTGSHSEFYNPNSNSWSSTSMPVNLADLSPCYETGPAVLRPDGTVFAAGATSNTAIYSTLSGTWTAGPPFPSNLGVVDGPAALLPNGNVLTVAAPVSSGSTCQFNTGSQFFEFNGSALVSVPAPSGASTESSFSWRMLVLPTGQILLTNGNLIQIYTSNGTFQTAWQPTISSAPTTVVQGTYNYSISGTQFNGLSQGAMYGDDSQMATNYPLVRITNNTTGHVFYARTHDHSTMGVATGAASVSTYFDVPGNIEVGASSLVVVANGIPSQPRNVTVTPSKTTSNTALMSILSDEDQYTVTVTTAGSGGVTSSDGSINCGTTCSVSYDLGSSVTLTATPEVGHSFSGWSGACTGSNVVCIVTMTNSANVLASFN